TLRDRDAERSALITEVQELESKWDPTEVERVELAYKEARESLFTGPEERDKWEKEIRSQALAAALGTTIQMGNAQLQPQTQHKLSVVPATLELHPASGVRTTNSAYE